MSADPHRSLTFRLERPGASKFVSVVDGIQRALRADLASCGFKVRGRTFNRPTADGLTQVVNFQMGSSDPPGTTYFPGLRENLHGLFTVNLGIYIPEVAELHGGGPAKSWVQEYHCSIRDRLGHVSGSEQDMWWHATNSDAVLEDVRTRLVSFGLKFLDRFASRDLVLSELDGHTDNLEHCTTPRIVRAIILAKRGYAEAARELLAAQASGSQLNRHHPAYVRELALRMGLEAI